MGERWGILRPPRHFLEMGVFAPVVDRGGFLGVWGLAPMRAKRKNNNKKTKVIHRFCGFSLCVFYINIFNIFKG